MSTGYQLQPHWRERDGSPRERAIRLEVLNNVLVALPPAPCAQCVFFERCGDDLMACTDYLAYLTGGANPARWGAVPDTSDAATKAAARRASADRRDPSRQAYQLAFRQGPYAGRVPYDSLQHAYQQVGESERERIAERLGAQTLSEVCQRLTTAERRHAE